MYYGTKFVPDIVFQLQNSKKKKKKYIKSFVAQQCFFFASTKFENFRGQRSYELFWTYYFKRTINTQG